MRRIGAEEGRPVDPLQNPYAPGAGTSPPALAGRDEQIERFEFLLGRLQREMSERSLIMHGLRGVGKTVLLTEFAARAERAGWAQVRQEIRREGDFGVVIARVVGAAIAELERRGPVREALRRAMRALASFTTTVSSDGRVTFGLEVEPAGGVADSGDLESDLVVLLAELGAAAAEARSGVALLLDELQLLERAQLEALVAAMHAAAQERLPLALVGAGLPTLPELVLDAKTYAERLFRFPALDSLDRDAARAALVEPAEALGVAFTDGAAERILAESEGYPYFLQEWGRAAWNAAADARIDERAVELAAPTVGEELDHDFFGMRVKRATAAELAYCRGLAGLGEGAHPAGEVAAALGRETRSLSPTRARLIEKGLIYASGRGQVAFTVPHFGRHLMRHES